VRKAQQAIAAFCLINSASAFALGVGDISTHSALNQVLNAKIPLISSKNEDPSNITITLASRESFKQAGIDRPQYLSDLKFTPIVGKNGDITINVTSNSSIKEPFVNFILEVEWPQGRTLKEFTILLDPPITMADVTTVPIELAKSTVMEPIPATTTRTNTSVTNTAPVTQASSTASYGPTGSNDTLWGIAKQLLTNNNSVSHQQMMMALFENNPKAFYKKNINALMKGKVLNVPSNESVQQLSTQQAQNAYNKHNAQWSSSATTKQSSNRASANSRINLDQSEDAKLTLLTPDEPAQSETSNNDATDDSATASAANDAIAQANIAMEVATSNEQKNEEVQSRLDELETQVEKLQRLIALKDSQLAQLQTKPATVETAVPSPQKQPVTPPAKAEAEESQWPLYAGGGLLIALLGVYLARRKSKEEDQPFPIDNNPSAEKDLFEDNTTSFVDDIEEQIVVEETEIESDSLLSEFTPSEFENLDEAHEADPLTECDVYIAYGRYQQAEDLIQNAITEDPTNQAFTLKLLDVYFSSDNAESFEKLAKELTHLKKTEPDVWDGIANMGAELCTDSALFSTPQQTNSDDYRENPSIEDELQELDTETVIEAPEELASFDIPETLGDELFAEEASKKDQSIEPPADKSDKSDFEFDFDLVKPDADSNTESEPVTQEPDSDAFELSNSEFGDSSENIADTKLSLAEAYIDMLDMDSAKEALDEVLEIGDIEQIASAKKLLNKL